MSELSLKLKLSSEIQAKCRAEDSSDHDLMTQIAAGEESAFVELVDRYGQTVARLIGRLTAWHSDSDDILQDVFLVAWRKADTFCGQGSAEGWLKRIAINRCRNHFRKLNVIKRNLERFAHLVMFNGRAQAEEILSSDEPDTELRQAMDELSPEDRLVLVLYYLEEMPGDRVAEILKMRPDAVYVRMHRARKKLKTILEKNQSES